MYVCIDIWGIEKNAIRSRVEIYRSGAVSIHIYTCICIYMYIFVQLKCTDRSGHVTFNIHYTYTYIQIYIMYLYQKTEDLLLCPAHLHWGGKRNGKGWLPKKKKRDLWLPPAQLQIVTCQHMVTPRLYGFGDVEDIVL